MLLYILEKTKLKKRLANFYRHSQIFRFLINYFGISAGASAFLFSLGGSCSCPHCGGYACPIGIISILIISAAAAAIATALIETGRLLERIKNYRKKNVPK